MKFVSAADLGSQSAGPTHTAAFTVASGTRSMLVVVFSATNTGTEDITVSSVTYNGVPMTLAKKVAPGAANARWTYLYYLMTPPVGALDVVVAMSATVFIGAVAAQYDDVQQHAQPSITASGNEAGTSDLDLTLTSPDRSWVLMGTSGYDGGNTSIAGTGTTKRISGGFQNNTSLFDSNEALAGSVTLHASYTNAVDMAGVLVAFSEEPARVIIAKA